MNEIPAYVTETYIRGHSHPHIRTHKSGLSAAAWAMHEIDTNPDILKVRAIPRSWNEPVRDFVPQRSMKVEEQVAA